VQSGKILAQEFYFILLQMGKRLCCCIYVVLMLDEMLIDVAFVELKHCANLIFAFSSRGHLTAVEYMFKKYIEKLRTHDPACPLCHRPFDEQTEVDELISEARIFAFMRCVLSLIFLHCYILIIELLLLVDFDLRDQSFGDVANLFVTNWCC